MLDCFRSLFSLSGVYRLLVLFEHFNSIIAERIIRLCFFPSPSAAQGTTMICEQRARVCVYISEERACVFFLHTALLARGYSHTNLNQFDMRINEHDECDSLPFCVRERTEATSKAMNERTNERCSSVLRAWRRRSHPARAVGVVRGFFGLYCTYKNEKISLFLFIWLKMHLRTTR